MVKQNILRMYLNAEPVDMSHTRRRTTMNTSSGSRYKCTVEENRRNLEAFLKKIGKNPEGYKNGE